MVSTPGRDRIQRKWAKKASFCVITRDHELDNSPTALKGGSPVWAKERHSEESRKQGPLPVKWLLTVGLLELGRSHFKSWRHHS